MHTDQVPRTTSLEALRSDVRNYPVCRTSPFTEHRRKAADNINRTKRLFLCDEIKNCTNSTVVAER